MTTATIRVGYEYRACGGSLDGLETGLKGQDKGLVWHIETTKMSGHDLASTDMGGWNLHVQHKYNFHSGILQKGDGNTIYLKYKPQVSYIIFCTVLAYLLRIIKTSCVISESVCFCVSLNSKGKQNIYSQKDENTSNTNHKLCYILNCVIFQNQSFSALKKFDCALAHTRAQNVLSAAQFCAHFRSFKDW